MSVRSAGAHTHPGLVWARTFSSTVLDLLFPPHCAACERYGAWLCTACIGEIEAIQAPICDHCGLPMRTPASGPGETVQHQDALCHFCSEIPLQLDGLRSYAYHVDPLRRAIRQFKYESLRALAAPLGELLIQAWDALFPSHCVIDAIVPVPLHARRERNRGYNQAALLSHALGQHLRIPVVEDALVRIRHTRPQVGLNVPQRQANLRGAFRSMSAGLAGGRVLLVDDVCTSGSTLEEAAAALREGGATTIWAYTLTRARQ